MRYFPVRSPNDILKRGLESLKIDLDSKSRSAQARAFHKHFGSSHSTLAHIWFDLQTTNIPGATLEQKENSDAGMKMFFVAHHFLWTYPKNSDILASRFSFLSERNSRGEPLWKWIRKIAALKEKKIVWDSRFDKKDSEVFILSVDGTDFKIWETKVKI